MTGVSLSAFLQFQTDMNKRLDAINSSVRAASSADLQSSVVGITGSIVGQNNKTVCCQLPGPPGGFEWHVRRISLGVDLDGLTTSVTQQGTVVLGKGSVSLGTGGVYTIGTPNTFIEITRTSVMPDAITFSASECVIRSQEAIVVAWVSGIGTITIDGDVEQVPSHGYVGLEA